MKKTFLSTVLLTFLVVMSVRADIIKGRVVDAETKEELPDVQLEYQETRGEYGWSINRFTTDSLGNFTFFAQGRGTLKAEMLGYYTKTKPVLAFTDSRKDTIDIGTIELKISPQMLKMLEVKGHARRFTVKGDTIVFHPEAFHLQEGARLDELIRKLPGVEVDEDGTMSWNGKPIRLTMDGESMLGGEELMKQLPVEAVENIKAYNKASEFSERTGKDDGTQDMVLDLTIKPGFLDRWYGDVLAGYETDKYYEGELSMNRLSKTDPMMVFADANNVDKMHRRSMNYGMSTYSNGFGKELGASAGWQHKWKRKEGTQEMKSQYSFSGGIAHDDFVRRERSETENYLPDTAANRSATKENTRHHQIHPTFNADLRWAPDSLNTYSLSATFEHTNHYSDARSEMEQSEQAQAATDATDVLFVPTLSQLTNTHKDGLHTRLGSNARWDHYIKDGSLGASVGLTYNDDTEDLRTERTITSHTATIASSQLVQTSTTPYKFLTANAEAHHARWLTKNWMMQAQYSFDYNRYRRDCDFLTNGVADAANSFRNHRTDQRHNIRLAQTINLSDLQILPTINARWEREMQDYQRGMLDTTAVRHSFIVDPSLRATWKISKTIGLELNYSFNTKQPELLNTLGYRDLTDPLFITEGNPNLKDSHIHDISLTYNMVLSRSQTSLSTTVSYQNHDRDEVSALSYNPATAVYVSRPLNVRGMQSFNYRLNYDQGIGDYLRLKNDLRLRVEQRYAYLILLPTEDERTVNRQNIVNPRDQLTLSLDYNWLKASVFASIDATRLRYSTSPEQNATNWNNSFGIEIEATYRNFVFETSLSQNNRHGYTDSSMNRDVLLWNGNITWKILKNKARVKLSFNDLLNNEDGLWCQQTAYQRTTSWSDFRHHYIGISFTYHLDAKKKE